MLQQDARTEQQVPKQPDPEGLEVSLTQLGLKKPHTLIAGFNTLLLCVLSKLSSPMQHTFPKVLSPKEYSEVSIAQMAIWRWQ